MFHTITEYLNGREICYTVDFTCTEQLVYSVAWPYTCNSIMESRHGINQLFNASALGQKCEFPYVKL